MTRYSPATCRTSPPEKENIVIRQKAEERFAVRHLERLRRPPLPDVGCDLVVDGSGVGRPVADMFEAAGLKPVQVYITSGFETERKAQRVFTVPKGELISRLDSVMHQGGLKIHTDLTESGALKEELRVATKP